MSLSPNYDATKYHELWTEIRLGSVGACCGNGKTYEDHLMEILVESNFVTFLSQSLCPFQLSGQDVRLQRLHITRILDTCSKSTKVGTVISAFGMLQTLLTALRHPNIGQESCFALPLLRLFRCARAAVPAQSVAERIDTADALITAVQSSNASAALLPA